MTSRTEMTMDELGESLTGYEEIAIEKAFGEDLQSLQQHKATMLARACVFVDLRRRGGTDKDAKHAAMEMPLRDVLAYFPDPDPDPDGEPGKDESEPEAEPKSSPRSAS